MLALCLAAATSDPAEAQDPPDTVITAYDSLRVEVLRLRAAGVPLGRLPFSAQLLGFDALPAGGMLTVADALEEAVGVSTASQFGSESQPDVRFRGFQVGPVVGYPQSVSVFVDGVRVNEPDASQVNFDLIPLQAVERMELIRTPGGPFGRNTLAGAVNVVTRSGDPDADVQGAAELWGASFGTAQGQGWVGGGLGNGLHYLASGRYHQSDGWRDLSATDLRQLFVKVGRRTEGSDIWLSYTGARNRIEGPGSLPRSWLRGELPPELSETKDPRRLQFTGFEGDIYRPRMHFAVLNAEREIGESRALHVNGFFRSNNITQFNDNISEPNVRGETEIRSFGGSTQLVITPPSGVVWTAGIEFIRNGVGILIFEEPNAVFPDAGGLTEEVDSDEDNFAGFAHLWWPVTARAGVTASLRYDYVRIPFDDRLDPENSGTNTFNQLTGSIGGDFRVSDDATVFGSYGRGFRAPVILEISCADPEDPCPLPFELGADPPLDAVRTDTWQAGLRYSGPGASRLEVVGYWAEVYDDLFNVTVPPSTRGFFRNLDRTRRQGLELSAAVPVTPDLRIRAELGLARATFETHATLASALLDDDDDDELEENGSDEIEEGEGAVQVEPGDHFAMVPNVTGGAEVEYTAGAWTVALRGSYVGSQYFVGDEGNDEEFGRLDGYGVLDGRIERDFGGWRFFLRGQNLADAEHNTFGIISPNIRGPDDAPQPFLSPAHPRSVQAGVRYEF